MAVLLTLWLVRPLLFLGLFIMCCVNLYDSRLLFFLAYMDHRFVPQGKSLFLLISDPVKYNSEIEQLKI